MTRNVVIAALVLVAASYALLARRAANVPIVAVQLLGPGVQCQVEGATVPCADVGNYLSETLDVSRLSQIRLLSVNGSSDPHRFDVLRSALHNAGYWRLGIMSIGVITIPDSKRGNR